MSINTLDMCMKRDCRGVKPAYENIPNKTNKYIILWESARWTQWTRWHKTRHTTSLLSTMSLTAMKEVKHCASIIWHCYMSSNSVITTNISNTNFFFRSVIFSTVSSSSFCFSSRYFHIWHNLLYMSITPSYSKNISIRSVLTTQTFSPNLSEDVSNLPLFLLLTSVESATFPHHTEEMSFTFLLTVVLGIDSWRVL